MGLKTKHWIGSAMAGALALGALTAPASAQNVSDDRGIIPISITYDVTNNTVVPEGSNIESPRQIAGETFIKLDLRLIVDQKSSDLLLKSFDGGYTTEPSGCAPGAYGPMAMETDLRYSITTPPVDGLSVRATIYPGDRSVHWANDAFCEFDESLGEAYAVAHITGFYYVVPRRAADAVDVQLRALVPTQGEVMQHLRGPR